MARTPISKKTRFDVFKRDSFTCQYCGATPPKVVLEVDHINPVSNGGKNSIDNLITSCFGCNRGKAAGLLSDIPQSLKDRAAEIKEREEQIKGYNAILTAKAARIENEAWDVAAAIEGKQWIEEFSKAGLQSIKTFLSRIPYQEVIEAAEIANSKNFYNNKKRFSYFCGICWRKIREFENGTR